MANLIQGVHHIALKATDFDRSLAFYRGLGFRPTMEWGSAGEQDTRAAMLDSGDGSCIELLAGGSRQQPGSWFHLAFRVPDCDAAYRAALELGAVCQQAPADVDVQSSPVTRIRIAFVEGPDGEVLEFFQYR